MPEYKLSTNGSGAGSHQTSKLEGILEGIGLTFDGSVAGTAVVTVTELEGLQRELLSVNTNTDSVLAPFLDGVESDGTALTVYFRPYINSRLNIAIASGGNNITDAVTVRVETVRR